MVFMDKPQSVLLNTKKENAFISKMDALNVWDWEGDYEAPWICDGPSWYFQLITNNNIIITSGYSMFPGSKKAMELSPGFKQLLDALNSLINRKDYIK